MSHVLINDVVKRYFLKQPRKLRVKIRDKFEFLESGIWDSGLKVKKLAGVSSRVIFEARLDRGNRILFSLGKDSSEGTEELMVYVWGVVVHDAVSRTMRRILPSEVPFLHFTDYREEIFDELDLEALPDSYFTQETISARVSEDSAAQRWHRVDPSEWDRILRYERDDFDLFMSLSSEQERILSAAPPLIISGTAGSGKTTLLVYYLLKKGLRQKSKLFLTYNRLLRDFAEKLYAGLASEQEEVSSWARPEFHTFKSFCLDIAQAYGLVFDPDKEVNFDVFTKFFDFHRLRNKFDVALVWEEIRSIIKGALPQVNLSVLRKAMKDLPNGPLNDDLVNKLQTQFVHFSNLESTASIGKFTTRHLKCDLPTFARQLRRHLEDDPDRVQAVLEQSLNTLSKQQQLAGRKHLSFFEYETLGKKKAPNFQFSRKEIYKIFEWYQQKLEQGGLWDELDLGREVTEIISERDWNDRRYDIVVCDEVQDLTDIQHDLLFSLVKNPNDLLLAGDTKQIINPSGFRWEELKRHFYERDLSVPDLRLLTLNFRSSGNIVELSNHLLELKREFLGVRAEENKEDWKYKGRPPVVVSGVSETAMLDRVSRSGANRTILVRTDTEREQLKKVLGTEIVFTLGEAKGLEFDTVLLWKFGGDPSSSDVWDVILKKSARRVHEARIRHEINSLYVGITRARRDLIVFDGAEHSSIWKEPGIAGQVFVTDDQSYLDGIWNVLSTPEEWSEQGTYFFERRYFKAAMECFKNAGRNERLAEASAYHYEQEGDYHRAALNFERIKDWERAAESYEKADRFDEALALWEKLRRKSRTIRCQIELAKGQSQFGQVARLYESIKDFGSAAEHFALAGEWASAATIYDRVLKQPEKAAEHYERAQQYKQAGKLTQRLKRLDKAAELYFKAADYSQAEKLWKRLKDVRNLVRLYSETSQPEKLLEIYEKEKDFKKSVRVLRSLHRSDLTAEADFYFGKRKYFSAWIRYHVAENRAGVAESCYRLRNYAEAARAYEMAGDMFSAGNAYQKDKQPQRAIECYMRSEEDKKVDYRKARKLLREADLSWVHDLGRKLAEGGELEPAALLYSLSYDPAAAGLCYAKLGDKERAKSQWGYYPSVETCEIIARRAAESGESQLAGEWILFQAAVGTPRSEGHLQLRDEQCPYVFAAVEHYLENCKDRQMMKRWARTLMHSEVDFENGPVIMRYLEQAGDYNGCFAYMENKRITGYERLDEDLQMFDRELSACERRADHGGLALRYVLLSRKEDLHRVIVNLDVTEDNTRLFEESDHYMTAVEFYFDSNRTYDVRLFFAESKRFLEGAEILESRGHASDAAIFYEMSGDLEGAIRSHEASGNHVAAGDLCFKIKDFSRALIVYSKSPVPPKKKIARTHERLGDWPEALKIYQELGDRKGCKRCGAKIAKQEARRLNRELPFLKAPSAGSGPVP